MVSPLPFDCVLLGLLLLTGSLEGVYIAEVGQNADLPCVYSATTSEALVPVCWGRGSCPVFECHSMVLSTDGRNVKYQTSNRYQLKRNIHKGDVSLTIENVTLADSGTYCCRIQFPGIMNDKKLNLELVIKSAKVTSAQTPWTDSTAAFPWILTAKGHGAETQTLEAFHDKQQTQIPTLANELQDAGATTRIGVYIGAGVSAGLALLLIIGALILTFQGRPDFPKQSLTPGILIAKRSYRIQGDAELNCNISFHSLVSLANPPPLGLANTGAEGTRSQENIYIIEENIYEMEDPYEYYCYVNNGQQS